MHVKGQIAFLEIRGFLAGVKRLAYEILDKPSDESTKMNPRTLKSDLKILGLATGVENISDSRAPLPAVGDFGAAEGAGVRWAA